MFRETNKEIQLDIFSNQGAFLSGKSSNFYHKENSWHNLFRQQITNRVEENLCKDLFSDGMGAPNASVCILIAMMVLKEANGWSDAQLFEQCRYNMLVRSALGLPNIDDAVPTESTYYLFRKRIVEHEKTGKGNLIETIFSDVTKSQVLDFEVSGKSIRMDSKLLGSNIAWFSRYELIHETLRLFCKDIQATEALDVLLPLEKILLESLLKEHGNKVVFRSTREEVKVKLQALGTFAYKLLTLFSSSQSSRYKTLKRVFNEQFNMDESKQVITRSKEEITSDSVQSPHDTDCTYRDKDGNKVKGYSINVTESCDKEKLNLIADVEVKVVNTPDVDFLKSSINNVKEIFTDTIENLHTDGAYHSPANQEFCKEESINFLLNAIQGKQGRFDLCLSDTNELTVTDRVTDKIVPVRELKGKWAIKVDNAYRYFTQKEIDACSLRKKIALIPQETLNIRNNVEATIFQLGFHYPNAKSRYRGLIKHKMWANVRCMWVNFVRIVNYIVKKAKGSLEGLKHAQQLFFFAINFILNLIFNPIILKTNLYSKTN